MGKVKQIEIKYRTYYFYNNLNLIDLNLLKTDKKNRTKILIFTTLDTSQLKILVIVKKFAV